MNADFRARLLYRTAALLGRLPWPVLKALADGLAWVWVRANARESRVVRRNLELAYPALDASQRANLHQAILRSTARQTFEMLRTWTRPPAQNLSRLRERHGQDLYDQALASGGLLGRRSQVAVGLRHGRCAFGWRRRWRRSGCRGRR